MEARYTQGPWHVQDNDGAYCMVRGKPEPGHNGQSIAKVWLQDANYHDANARLIAAAPEMLEALKLLQFALTDDVTNNDGKVDFAACCDIIDRAIAKVEGGS